ncbi:MAG: thioredoxin family protein [Candidatus Marinimicrobia bacterium]|nr:thioredoxin family protein [Candidatus Neomarinimicrobiota bacterium]|tara:strand:- start:1419 stop:2009 length:591 start_codon:yes stop_codon:yes gene_type:complete
MRSKFILLFTIIYSSLFCKELELGSNLPFGDHRLLDISGKYLSLNNVKGENGLLVIFSCNTCPWVIRWEDRYVSLAKKYVPMGIGVIAVNSNESNFQSVDNLEEMRKHAEYKQYNFPYVQDFGSRLARIFGATRTPHIYLFDDKDNLVYRGAIDDNPKDADDVDESYLKNAMDAMLSGKSIKVASTKAIGCGIKFK